MAGGTERGSSRRAFLGSAGAAGAALVIPEFALGGRRRRRPATGGEFNHGVASGQPTPRGITLWTQVEGVPDRRVRIELEISPDPDFRRVIHRERAFTNPGRDFTFKERVTGKPLRPGEQYYFRFESTEDSSPVGRFRTALPPGSLEPVRIGFFACQDYESGFYTAHAGLAEEEDLDIVVCLGDYIYERSFESEPVREDNLGANGDGEVQTQDEYRAKYNLYHSDPNLQALRASHPMIAIWDDHEAEDNYARFTPGEATLDRRIPFKERRQNGYKAFFEHMPLIRVKTPRRRVRDHGVFRLGRNVDLFYLDERRFRDDQPCGDQIGAPCPPEERNAPGRTMLGERQKNWLKRRLERSETNWRVIANQVMMMALDAPPGNPLNPDQWDGYGAERRELLEFARDRGIEDITLLTGDIHTFFAGIVTPSGRALPGGGERAVATEFVGGSMTSKGIADSVGREQGRDITGLVGDEGVVKRNNPHIKFSNQSDKGYGVMEVRPDELRVSFRAPGTTQERESPVSTVAEFRVARGTPDVQVLSGGGPA